jgi:hypothetical protein
LGNFVKNSSSVLKELESRLSKGNTEEQQKLEDRVLGYQKKIKDFSELIKNYKQTAGIFDFIRDNSHPKVWFYKIDFSLLGARTLISGEAEDFQAIEQQLLIFRKSPLIKSVNISNVLTGKEGKIDFTFIVLFKEDILKPAFLQRTE